MAEGWSEKQGSAFQKSKARTEMAKAKGIGKLTASPPRPSLVIQQTEQALRPDLALPVLIRREKLLTLGVLLIHRGISPYFFM